jgi:hypothetical protein
MCGYNVVHWYFELRFTGISIKYDNILDRYESIAWIPNVVGYIVILAVGAQHLTTMKLTPPSSLAAHLSFGATVGSGVLSWCTITPDYGVFHDNNASRYAYTRSSACEGASTTCTIVLEYSRTPISDFLPHWYARFTPSILY